MHTYISLYIHIYIYIHILPVPYSPSPIPCSLLALCRIAPFGKEDTAKELQDHAAKTQDTLVDAVENAEVAEIKRAVFRALTRLRAATIKECLGRSTPPNPHQNATRIPPQADRRVGRSTLNMWKSEMVPFCPQLPWAHTWIVKTPSIAIWAPGLQFSVSPGSQIFNFQDLR